MANICFNTIGKIRRTVILHNARPDDKTQTVPYEDSMKSISSMKQDGLFPDKMRL